MIKSYPMQLPRLATNEARLNYTFTTMQRVTTRLKIPDLLNLISTQVGTKLGGDEN